ncbi:MAG TPA: methane monooxygenase/ammonia monooxygenase subunit A [Porticoccaceae bacterium]|nr:methane monooxygenase/ammonia monooxygenase subunit A [Porticoccaceae bacterium]
MSDIQFRPVSHEADIVGRFLEWVIVPAVLLVVIGSFHLHAMLTMGDWDFWLDWKDREFWITITPILIITYCGALHYILWAHFRLPFGATFAVLCLLIGEWIVRVGAFHSWSYYPINLVTPATFFAGAIALDTILLLTRSVILTGIVGGSMFALLFFPTNWAWLAAYHVPVESNGIVMTLADLIGFEYIRTGTPEYIRIIERGTLRTFGQHSTAVSAAFAAFISIFMYWLWWYIGKLFSVVKYVKGHI